MKKQPFFRKWHDILWYLAAIVVFIVGVALLVSAEYRPTDHWMGYVLYIACLVPLPLLTWKYSHRLPVPTDYKETRQNR